MDFNIMWMCNTCGVMNLYATSPIACLDCNSFRDDSTIGRMWIDGDHPGFKGEDDWGIRNDGERQIVGASEAEELESKPEPEPPSTQEETLESLKNLKRDGQQEREEALELEEAQRERYKKKKNRWSVGGTKKREHDQTPIESRDNSDSDDVDPLDDLGTGSRRLRRRTCGGEDAMKRRCIVLDTPLTEVQENEDTNGFNDVISSRRKKFDSSLNEDLDMSSSELDAEGDVLARMVAVDNEDKAEASKIKSEQTEPLHDGAVDPNLAVKLPSVEDPEYFDKDLHEEGPSPRAVVERAAEQQDASVTYSDSDGQNYLASLFSFGQSSVTSQTSIMSDSIASTALEQLVSLLLEQESLRLLCVQAVEHASIGPARFERNFQRLLKEYARALEESLSDGSHKRKVEAVRFVHDRARITAGRVRRACDKSNGDRTLNLPLTEDDKRRKVEEYLDRLHGDESEHELAREAQDSSEDSNDDSDGEERTTTAHLNAVRDFLVNGPPFQRLCQNLASFILPSWEKRLSNLSASLSKGADRLGLSKDEIELVKLTVAKFAEADLNSIVLLKSHKQSWSERLQTQSEKETRTTWDWWPLAKPRPAARQGWNLIEWQCNCGERLWDQLPSTLLPEFRLMLTDGRDDAIQLRKSAFTECAPQQGANNISSGSQQNAPSSGPSHRTSFPNAPHRVYPGNGNGTRRFVGPGSAPNTSGTPNHGSMISRRLVFLTVSKNEDYRLAQIEALALEDDCFFEKLKDEYIRKRGYFRMLLSPWRYAGCEFRRAEKFLPWRIAPSPEVEMPQPNEPRYHFQSTKTRPPIVPHIFKVRFYECTRGGKSHKHWWQACRMRCSNRKDYLEKIPKREHAVDEDNEAPEMFWGLLAIEEIQFLRIAVYTIAMTIAPLGFWVFWMKAGHPADLQNATVPLMVLLTSMALLVSSWRVLGNQ